MIETFFVNDVNNSVNVGGNINNAVNKTDSAVKKSNNDV